MEQMKKGFADMSSKMEHTNTSVDIIRGRLDIIEKINEKSEAKNLKQFQEIKKDIENTKVHLESKVTENVISKLQPQITQ